MAQRGGSVITYVRMGPRVHSPVVEPGQADVILAFEQLEALRWAHLLARGGVLLMNESRVIPMSVGMGQARYPEGVADRLQQVGDGRAVVRSLDATGLARETGSEKAVNIVMLGAMARCLAIGPEVFIEAIADVFASRLQDLNRKAFEAGFAIMKENAGV